MTLDDNNLQRVFKINGEVVTRSIVGETILVPIRGKLAEMEKIFFLNRVGEFIWRQIDGRISLHQICDKVVERFEVGRPQAEEDVLNFTDALVESGLLIEHS
jgi:hypothetical protein